MSNACIAILKPSPCKACNRKRRSAFVLNHIPQKAQQSRLTSAPRRCSLPMTTLSKFTGRVSEQRWPMLISLPPNETPSVSDGTMKPDMRLCGLAVGSVTANTKSQDDTDAFVIHNLAVSEGVGESTRLTRGGSRPEGERVYLQPLITYLSPSLTARVEIDATSLPAPGSVTPENDHESQLSRFATRTLFFFGSDRFLGLETLRLTVCSHERLLCKHA